MSRKSKSKSAAPASPAPRKGLPRTVRLLISLALVLGMAALYWYNPTVRHQRRIIALGEATKAHNVAFGCLGLAETATTAETFSTPDKFATLPPAIRDLKPTSVSVDPAMHAVGIELGSGDDHYGYRFEPVGTSKTVWRLLLYSTSTSELHEVLELEHESLKDPNTGAITNRLVVHKK